MGDENHIRTLRNYSKPSHEGYKNTIELPVGNNVDPNQHLKDFLKLVDSLDLDGENKERTRLRLFQFSLRDQASNWLKRLPVGSITTWEDLTTRFLAQFFPPRRTAKLRNDILMFQQHHEESLSEAWTRFKDLLQKSLIIALIFGSNVKLRDRNAEESWESLEDLALYNNESWNDPRDFSKPVKEIALPQDVPSTSDRCLIKLENQLNDAPIPESTGDSMAFENTASISHIEREDLKRNGIKSPSKLFSLKCLSPASIIKLNKNPSALKRIHFVNLIVILNKESEAEEGETTTDITLEHDHNITKEAKDEVKEVMKEEESEVETDWEVEKILKEEEEDEDGEYFNSFPTM
ncbi:MAK10-like protein [Tanacetum coccineum]